VHHSIQQYGRLMRCGGGGRTASLGVQESVSDLEEALQWAHAHDIELIVDVGSLDALQANGKLAACLEVRRYGGREGVARSAARTRGCYRNAFPGCCPRVLSE
jgi:hypothetical protein